MARKYTQAMWRVGAWGAVRGPVECPIEGCAWRNGMGYGGLESHFEEHRRQEKRQGGLTLYSQDGEWYRKGTS